MFSVYSGLGLNVWERYHRTGDKKSIGSLGMELELETLAKHSPQGSRPAPWRSPGGGKGRRSLRGAGAGEVVSTTAASAAAAAVAVAAATSPAARHSHQEEKESLLRGSADGKDGRNFR